MKRIIMFISLLFIVSNLYALNTKEMLEIVENRSLKYEEAIEILSAIKGEELLNRYWKTDNCLNIDDKCPSCKLKINKGFWIILDEQNDEQKNLDILHFIFIIKCDNCGMSNMDYVQESINAEGKASEPIKDIVAFYGRLSKEDIEKIENIKNKKSYKECIDIIENFYSNLKEHFCGTKNCPHCNNVSLRILGNMEGNMEDNFEGTRILTCKNKDCKFFALFKKNSETKLFDCLYYGKYNNLEDVLLEHTKKIKRRKKST